MNAITFRNQRIEALEAQLAAAQRERDDALAEVTRLRAIEGRWMRLMELAAESEEMRLKASALSSETDRLNTVLELSGGYDHRKKEWRDYSAANKLSNKAWIDFNQIGLRNIGLTVLDMWRRQALEQAANADGA